MAMIENWGFGTRQAAPSAPSVSKVAPGSAGSLDQFIKANGLNISGDEFLQKYGAAPEGGWNDGNIYQTAKTVESELYKSAGIGDQMTERLGSADDSLQGWMKDTSLLASMPSLYGDGSDAAIQRGFNILQYMAPRNIGEFQSLDAETKKAILSNPGEALRRMQQLANPSSGDWLSTGAEGGFKDIGSYSNDGTSLTVNPDDYLQIQNDDGWSDIASLAGTALMFVPGMQLVGAGLSAVTALHNDNPLGAALAVAGAAVPNLGGQIGNAVSGGNLAANSIGARAIGSGLMSGAAAAANGGDLLKSAAIGGATGAAGAYAGDTLKDAGFGKEVSGAGAALTKNVVGGLLAPAIYGQPQEQSTQRTAATNTFAQAPSSGGYSRIEKWGF